MDPTIPSPKELFHYSSPVEAMLAEVENDKDRRLALLNDSWGKIKAIAKFAEPKLSGALFPDLIVAIDALIAVEQTPQGQALIVAVLKVIADLGA